MNQIVILAGGQGTRMQSELPKVLHPVKGIPIIERIINNIKPLFARPVVLVGFKGNEIRAALGKKIAYVYQAEQRGTGHAVWCTKPTLAQENYKNIIVIPGDHPLLTAATLKKLIKVHDDARAKISLATVLVPDFKGDYESFYHCGRIIRDSHQDIKTIVEFKDASAKQKKLKEVNISFYCFSARWLWRNIEKLNNKNKAGEYYLTDMIKIAAENGDKVSSFIIDDAFEGLGVNNQRQLEIVAAYC